MMRHCRHCGRYVLREGVIVVEHAFMHLDGQWSCGCDGSHGNADIELPGWKPCDVLHEELDGSRWHCAKRELHEGNCQPRANAGQTAPRSNTWKKSQRRKVAS